MNYKPKGQLSFKQNSFNKKVDDNGLIVKMKEVSANFSLKYTNLNENTNFLACSNDFDLYSQRSKTTKVKL